MKMKCSSIRILIKFQKRDRDKCNMVHLMFGTTTNVILGIQSICLITGFTSCRNFSSHSRLQYWILFLKTSVARAHFAIFIFINCISLLPYVLLSIYITLTVVLSSFPFHKYLRHPSSFRWMHVEALLL